MGVLQDRIIIVTGAGRGLGRAYAMHAASEGAVVVVNDLNAANATSVAGEIVAAGGRAVARPCSVSDAVSARHLVDSTVVEFGRLDGLVNNAGIQDTADPWEPRYAQIQRVIETNVLGVMFCGTAALAHMVNQRSGAIVNATSGAHLGLARMAAYAASKGAVASATYNWALDMMPHNVRVNAISPLAATQIADSFGPNPVTTSHPNLAGGTAGWMPERNAPVVTFLLSDLSDGITGQLVRIFGRNLSVMHHPTAGDPVLQRDEWDLESVTEAFRTTLRHHLQPYGVGVTEYGWEPREAATRPAR